jgi:hypothetical protein
MTVDEIFQSVMRTFHYTSDKELFQCAEYWQTVDELQLNGDATWAIVKTQPQPLCSLCASTATPRDTCCA